MNLAVIFDMDGVIVHSNPWHQKAWKAFFEKRGIHLSEEELKATVYGRTGFEALPRVLGRSLSRETVLRHCREIDGAYRRLFRPHIQPLPGLRRFLGELKNHGIPLAIATSAPPVNVDFVLKNTDLAGWFPLIVDSTFVKRGKPHPDIYLTTAGLMGMPPESCVVFEDSLSGVEAALSAGMRVIGVTTTHTREELAHTRMMINDFDEISMSDLENLS